jgi:hypothetical protein
MNSQSYTFRGQESKWKNFGSVPLGSSQGESLVQLLEAAYTSRLMVPSSISIFQSSIQEHSISISSSSLSPQTHTTPTYTHTQHHHINTSSSTPVSPFYKKDLRTPLGLLK